MENILRLGSLAVSCTLLTSSVAVAAPEVARTYELSESGVAAELAAQDRACVNALVEGVAPDFEGLKRISIQGASYVMPTETGYLATYAKVIFESQYGNAEGAVSCVYTADGRDVTDVAVSFVSPGLAGFTRHPLRMIINDPAERRISGTGAQIVPR